MYGNKCFKRAKVVCTCYMEVFIAAFILHVPVNARTHSAPTCQYLGNHIEIAPLLSKRTSVVVDVPEAYV